MTTHPLSRPQVRFPLPLQQALNASDWTAVKAWAIEHPHLHTVPLAAALLNWAATRQAEAVLPVVWAMVPQALSGHERFWAQATPAAMRFALLREPLLRRWAERVTRRT